MAALLQLGVGFQRDLTGRENVYLNSAMLGIDQKTIEKKMAEIISFAELEDFIDMPLKTYSSGMVARLGFSIGLKMQADLLLIDEVLGVGDAAFRKKATQAMKRRINSDQTVMLASHSDVTILELCERVIWLEDGEVRQQGDPARVIEAYQEQIQAVKGVGRPRQRIEA